MTKEESALKLIESKFISYKIKTFSLKVLVLILMLICSE